ncbi:MAG TPA: hypothetical protein VFT72_06905 [Opitutaceae bacterium]|nr:hypothetical protein [Opitutaceae bacterium]
MNLRSWLNSERVQRALMAYHAFAESRSEFFAIVMLMPFSVFVVLGLSVVFFVEQSLEAFRVLAENWTGTMVALIFTLASLIFLSISAWRCARVLVFQLDPESIFATGMRGWASRWLPRLIGATAWLAFAAASWAARVAHAPADTHLAIMSILCALGAVLFLLLTGTHGERTAATRRAFLNQTQKRNFKHPAEPQILYRQLPLRMRIFIDVSNVLWAVTFILILVTKGQIARHVGTIGVLLFSAATAIPVGSGVFYVGKLLRVPLLTIIVVAVLVFSGFDLNDNHPLRQLPTPSAKTPENLSAAFDEWLQSRADLKRYPDGEYPVVLVAAEGGGLRTAYNSALILSAIQDRCPAFAQHIFAMSGVSGGSVGTSVFAALCAEQATNSATHPARVDIKERGPMQQKADEVLREDFLSPLIAYALYPDLVQRALPWAIDSFDRSRALEAGLERAWRNAFPGSHRLEESFDALRAQGARGSTPALFLNTTVVESGERLVISHYQPDSAQFEHLRSLADIDPLANVPLSTAAVASARFTYVTPVAYVMAHRPDKSEKLMKVRLADGGYFENSGMATLGQIASALGLDDPQKPKRFRLIVLQLTSPNRDLLRGIKDPQFSYGFGEAASPILTLLNTRSARGVSATRNVQTLLNEYVARSMKAELISFELAERDVPVPLGWLLSNQAKKEMMDQLGAPIHGPLPPGTPLSSPYNFARILDLLQPTTGAPTVAAGRS